MLYEKLTTTQLKEVTGGEFVTLTAIIGVCVLSIICVMAYKILRSTSGKLKMPGDFQFEWKD
jgi:bacteriocin-like protein